jgi:ADP-dependent NAD(P)H-hydrate dehydratase / NAD(P)H-hydrate epimerase
MSLPSALYTGAQVRELDRTALHVHAIPGLCLMERAGSAAFELARQLWPQARRWGVFCGAGNNAGDGYVVARLAHSAGIAVDVIQVGDSASLKGDARTARDHLHALAVPVHAFNPTSLAPYDLIIDALLGTGLDRDLHGIWASAVTQINASGIAVLALDIPTGLHADRGSIMGCAIQATATLTFIGLKQGLCTGAGPQHCGALYFDDLAVPPAIYAHIPPNAQRLDARSAHLPLRRRDAHKGDFGHVLIIGGNSGYSGAARLAALAALRTGAGLVSLATRQIHAEMMSLTLPELMSHGCETGASLEALAQRANVIAIGPGLGQDDWAQLMLQHALALNKPLIIDADALNLIAAHALILPKNTLITPHPGEAARLLGIHSAAVQADRFAAVHALHTRYGAVCVLKGAGTLIAAADASVALCHAGNPGMACGGMGDVLTGMIAALVAQGLTLANAARLGVCLHARAADKAVIQRGEHSLLPSDLFSTLTA